MSNDKLTIEELSAYLPFKPKAKMLNYKCDYVGKEIDTIIGLEQWDKSGKHWSLFTEGGSKPSLKDIKLLLRPLSQLTLNKIKELFGNDICDFRFETIDDFSLEVYTEMIGWTGICYKDYCKLLSLHFDIFGLLDRNLAEPIV